jgi:sugar (pentulose or hexulose) kinase
VGYLLTTIVSHVETITGPLKEIRVGGDCMNASFPRRLLADMTGRRIVVPSVAEPVGVGAARLGFRALGADKDWDRAAQVPCSATIEPNPAAVAYYREWRLRAAALYRREGLQA